ncbi:hypothetical protein BG005_001885, partial [Podila minutissima]
MPQESEKKAYLKKHAEAENKCIRADEKHKDAIKKHAMAIRDLAPDKKIGDLKKEMLRLEEDHRRCIAAVLKIEKQEQDNLESEKKEYLKKHAAAEIK